MIRMFGGVALVALLTVDSLAQPLSWNREANIEASAEQLGRVVKAKGADRAAQEIQQCYKQNGGKKYSKELEGCLVQDIIHSQVSAAMYARISKEMRARVGLPEPDAIVAIMTKRVTGAFRSAGVSEPDALQFSKLVRERGLPAYEKGQR